MKKWIFVPAIALLLAMVMPVSVFAHAVPEVDRTDCAIEMTLQYDGEPVAGGTLMAVRVGYVYENNGDYSLRRFVDDKPVEDVQSAAAAAELEQFYREHQENGQFHISVSTVGQDGTVCFEGLATGLYLILQETPAPGYSALSSFLVTLPYLSEGVYQYRVSSTVKTELVREPVPTEPEPTVPSGDKLPQTGQLNWPVPVLAVAGLGCLIVGFWLRSDRKKDVYEK